MGSDGIGSGVHTSGEKAMNVTYRGSGQRRGQGGDRGKV